jgi:hypothetical protein
MCLITFFELTFKSLINESIKMNKAHLITLLTLSAFVSGCSTLTGEGTSQNLSVMTYTNDNKDMTGASCELKNDEGTWTAVTPATVMVRRSNKDLMVKCTKSGFADARANVVSKTKANMWGNIIVGGGIGAIIDHNNGSAYQYPPVLKLTMGQDSKIEEGSK